MSIRRTLQANLIAGVLVLTPAVVSLYVFVQLFLALDRPLANAVRLATGYRIPGVGFAALVILVLLVGVFTRNVVGSHLVGFARRAMTSVPLLGTLYGVLEQTLGMIMSGRGKGFRRVVMVEYPVAGIWSIGLVAGEGGIGGTAQDGPLTRVFVPTSPNPTSGFLLLVSPMKLRELPVPVEEAVKMLVSGGLVVPRPFHPSSSGVGHDTDPVTSEAANGAP
ncbi:DUF502 domain-containing protein [Candidatus Fermentibacteria bacterium]|nr:DUF502 domain-containing protein [Candidatus Fermentibacteria bacterium]